MSEALRKVGIQLLAKGTAEFKRDLQSATSSIKLAKLEMDRNVAQLGIGASKTATYTAKVKQLSSSMDLAQNKVALFKTRQLELKSALTDIPNKIQKVETQLKNSEKAYVNTSNAIKKQKEEVLKLASTHGKTSTEYKQAVTHLKELEQANKSIKTEVNAHKKAVNELISTESTWQKELSGTSAEIVKAETNVFKLRNEVDKLHKEYRESGGALADTAQKFTNFGEKAQKIGQTTQKIGGSLTKMFTVPLGGAIALSAKQAMEFEDAFTGVVKTVDAPASVLDKLRERFIKLSTEIPISANELANIGESAGQLGIKVPNIEKFTKTIAMLGKTTNLSSEQGASELARFMNVMGTSQNDVDRLASTIVALGNNFATTESDISAMAQRLSGAGHQVGMTESDVLALATALSSVGIEAEAGGSAMSGIIKKMFNAADHTKRYTELVNEARATLSKSDFKKTVKELGKDVTAMTTFAETAGMSIEDFAKLVETRPVEALDRFIRGLDEAKLQGENMNDILADVNIKGLRSSDGVLRLSGASKILGESVGLASSAWKENNALQKEASKRFETTSSKLQIAKNKIKEQAIAIGSKLLPKIVNLIDKSEPLIKFIGGMIDGFTDLPPLIQLFVTGAGPVLSLVGKLSSGLGGVSKGVGWLIQTLGKFAVPKAVGELGGQLGLLPSLAQTAGSAAGFFTNPWLLGFGAVAAAGGAIWASINAENNKDQTAHNQAVELTKGKYQEWFDAVTEGSKNTVNNQKLIQNSTKRTGETYKEVVNNIKKQNTEVQNALKNLWQDSYNVYDVDNGEEPQKKDGLRSKLNKVGMSDEDINKIKDKYAEYATILANHQNTLNNAFINHQKVTDDMVNATLIANEYLVSSLLEDYSKEKDAEIRRLEEKRQRIESAKNINETYRQQQIESINKQIADVEGAYKRKESTIQEIESNINKIMTTAAVENRELTSQEIASIILEYKHMEDETGKSMANNKQAQDVLAANLANLTNATVLSSLQQAGIIDETTRKKIENYKNEKNKINAIKSAIANYNAQNFDAKNIDINTSEARNKIAEVIGDLNSIHDKRVSVAIEYMSVAGPRSTKPAVVPNAIGSHIQPFATGGNIQPTRIGMNNFVGLVGEAGPELVRFDRRGVHVTPLSTREKMKGISQVIKDHTSSHSNGSVINVTINNPVVKNEQDINQLTQQVSQALAQAFKRQQAMKGGVYT